MTFDDRQSISRARPGGTGLQGTPTPVQSAVLESGAEDRDLLVSAQTGSGKTVAYGLAIAPTILGEAQRLGAPAAPLVLTIAPTTGAGASGGAGAGLAVPARRRDRYDLRRRHGFAARAARSARRGAFCRRHARDGCATTSNAGTSICRRWRSWCSTRRTRCSTSASRRTWSSSLKPRPPSVAHCCSARPCPRTSWPWRGPIKRTRTASTPRGSARRTATSSIAPCGWRRTRSSTPWSTRFASSRRAAPWCSARHGKRVRHLHAALRERGFDAVALSGEMSQRERTDALQALRDRRARVCVATDVAARGLDLPDLGLVIHADLPSNRQALLHRSGRTGRAGKKGISVVLGAVLASPPGRAVAERRPGSRRCGAGRPAPRRSAPRIRRACWPTRC